MSSSVNKVFLVGTLGADPELKAISTGTTKADLRIATNRKYKKNDQWVEETDWHNVQIWGASAEACGKFLKKGSRVHVEGRLKTESWESEGVKKYRTFVVADDVTFLDRKPEGDATSRYGNSGAGNSAKHAAPEEDLPF